MVMRSGVTPIPTEPTTVQAPEGDLNFYSNYVHDNSTVSNDYFGGYTTGSEAAIKIEISQYVNVYDNVITNNFPWRDIAVVIGSRQRVQQHVDWQPRAGGDRRVHSEREVSSSRPMNHSNTIISKTTSSTIITPSTICSSSANGTYYAGQTQNSASPNNITITRVGSTATVTTPVATELATGDLATIANASQTQYNGTFQVTVTDSTHFTYTVSGSPASPATSVSGTNLAETPLASDNNVVDYNLYYRFGGPLQLSQGNDGSFSPTTSTGGNKNYANGMLNVFTSFSNWQSTNSSGWTRTVNLASPDWCSLAGGIRDYPLHRR